MSLINNSQAGFYDWLVSSKPASVPLVSLVIRENNASFDKLFAWNNRKLDSAQPSKIITEDIPTEPKIELKVIKTYTVRATGYSSTVDQTDSSPFITAKGTYVRDGIIAANFLPFNTKIRIPEIYGDRIFIVEDRMNKRYWHNIDIWFPERNLALWFGSQHVTIEVVEEY